MGFFSLSLKIFYYEKGPSSSSSYGSCEFESRLLRGVQVSTLCDKVCQWFASGQWFTSGRWFSLGTVVSSTNKTDTHEIIEILLKVALSTITLILLWELYLIIQVILIDQKRNYFTNVVQLLYNIICYIF
jgi:hypothetical protein